MKSWCLLFILSIIILSGLSYSETSGGELVAKQGNCIDLPQECASCSYVKLTSITYPNMSRLSVQSYMTKDGTSYNYTFCGTESTGTYTYCVLGDVDGEDTVACNDFSITPNGYELSTAQGILYIIFIIGMIGLLLLLLYGSITLPYKNVRDDDDFVIGVNNLKYLKVFCIIFSYLCLLFISGMLQSLFSNYLLFDNASQFFNVSYWILLSGMFPAIVIGLLMMFINFIHDKKVNDALMRGVPFR